ncbi:MAG: chromate transporter [Anaerovoracaceae bacterium]|nr:chromate transporter [Anaerovoracaceae bacterium]
MQSEMLKELFEIYFTSVKVGAMTFGGGYAMLPILQKEVVEKKPWNTEEEILDYYALAQCLPGIIMVNTLAFVGQKRKGTAGAIASGLGAVTPPLIIITVIAALLTAFADVPAVQNAFAGIRVCVCVLIFNSILKLWKSSMVDKKCLAIFLVVAAGSLFLDLSPILFVAGAGILGILIQIAGRSKAK